MGDLTAKVEPPDSQLRREALKQAHERGARKTKQPVNLNCARSTTGDQRKRLGLRSLFASVM